MDLSQDISIDLIIKLHDKLGLTIDVNDGKITGVNFFDKK